MQGTSSAMQVLAKARTDGRPIVPFLAAGLSAASGYPLLFDLRSYLLKVKFHILSGSFLQMLGLRERDRSARRNLLDNPAEYISRYGWPSPSQLNLHLFNSFVDTNRAAGGKTVLDRIALSEKLPAAIQRESAKDAYTKHFSQVISGEAKDQKGKPRIWGVGRWAIESITNHMALETLRQHDEGLAEAVQEEVWESRLSPRSDWSALLMDITEGRLGLVDALFSHLSARHSPAFAHTMLAHLTTLLRIKLILTTNFDPYIEMALHSEGVAHRVFDVGRDETPPAASVLKQALSIIKLHGSGFGVRVGETLDYELDDSTRTTLLDAIPNNALLLVIGFSGNERRMMQLIEHIAIRNCSTRPISEAALPGIVWMHYESEDRVSPRVHSLDGRLKRLCQTSSTAMTPEPIVLERLSDSGAFLLETYQNLTSKFPHSRAPLQALTRRLVTLGGGSSDNHNIEHKSKTQGTRGYLTGQEMMLSNPTLCHVFYRKSLDDLNFTSFLITGLQTPSLKMSDAVQGFSTSHKVIWIDLEEHHTVAGVLVEIVDKMRVFDPELAPFDSGQVPPDYGGIDQSDSFLVSYFIRALKRGRYCLAFDGLESFTRVQTSHHGVVEVKKPIPEYAQDPIFAENNPDPMEATEESPLKKLIAFLQQLIFACESDSDFNPRHYQTRFAIDWMCCISCDEPTDRHYQTSVADNCARNSVRAELNKFIKCVKHITAHIQRTSESDASYANMKKSVRFHVIEKSADDAGLPDPFGMNDNRESACERMISLIQPVVTCANDSFLRKGSTSPTRNDLSATNDCVHAFFLWCAVVRRPRPKVLLSYLWDAFMSWRGIEDGNLGQQLLGMNDVQTGEAKRAEDKDGDVEPALSALVTRNILRTMDGGFYWIPQHMHFQTYQLLTDHLFYEKMNEAMRKGDVDGLMRNLTTLIPIILIHSNIARWYYLHAFIRTKDPNAFFEYLYHRVSSLRYLRNLTEILQSSWASVGSSENKKRIHTLIMRLYSCDGESLLTRIEYVDIDTEQSTLDSVLNVVQVIRVKCLQSLLNALRREEEITKTTGSTDTWIAWFSQLLLDLKAMKTKVDDSQRFLQLSHELELWMINLIGRLFGEKRSWQDCRHQRRLYLSRLSLFGSHPFSMPEPNRQVDSIKGLLQGAAKQFSQGEILLEVLFDLAWCEHRINDGNKEFSELLHKLYLENAKWLDGADQMLYLFRYRFEMLQLEIQVESLLVWEKPCVDWRGKPAHKELRQRCLHALKCLENLKSKVRGEPVQHRTEVVARLSDIELLKAQCHIWLDEFLVAHSAIAESESGLINQSMPQQYRAFRISIVKAECLMRESDKMCRDSDRAGYTPSPSAMLKLIEAEERLTEAEGHLRRGRRDITTWRKYLEVRLQLQIEFLLLDIANLEEPEDLTGPTERVTSHCLNGLQTIRSLLDTGYGQSEEQERTYLVTKWHMLFVLWIVARWLDRIVRVAVMRNPVRDTAIMPRDVMLFNRDTMSGFYEQLREVMELDVESTVNQWKAFNKAAGLDQVVIQFENSIPQSANRSEQKEEVNTEVKRVQQRVDLCQVAKWVLFDVKHERRVFQAVSTAAQAGTGGRIVCRLRRFVLGFVSHMVEAMNSSAGSEVPSNEGTIPVVNQKWPKRRKHIEQLQKVFFSDRRAEKKTE
jgi:hypothetical protein